MTKIAAKFARALGAHLVGTQVIDSLILFHPTRHLVRGFLLDGTPRKNHLKLMRFVVPLYSPFMTNLSLNYSEVPVVDGRPHPELVLDQGADALALQVGRLLSERFCAEVKGLDFKGFLQRHEVRIGIDRHNIALEFAIAHYLTGEIDGARVKLEAILARPADPDDEVLVMTRVEVKRLLHAMDEGEKAVATIIQEYEDRNIAKHFPGLILDRVTS